MPPVSKSLTTDRIATPSECWGILRADQTVRRIGCNKILSGELRDTFRLDPSPRAPDDPIRSATVTLNHRDGLLSIAQPHQTIICVFHANAVGRLVDDGGWWSERGGLQQLVRKRAAGEQ